MTQPVQWTPLFLSAPRRDYAFGGTLIRERLHKEDIPDGEFAESWEVSDYGQDSDSATVLNGPFQGRSLRELVRTSPQELVGPGFSGPYFPLLAKFLDASHMLPVHLHVNDAVAARKYGQPNGKTEAWHIVWAAPGASILAGVKPGVTPQQLRSALRQQRYDDVMPRHPIRRGDTVYVPGGVLHSFGPDALVYEIQQTSDLGVSAMPEDLYGQPLTAEQWQQNIEGVLDELVWEPLPVPQPGLSLPAEGAERRMGALGPHFALERLSVNGTYRWPFQRAQVLTTLEQPVDLLVNGATYHLKQAQSVLLPAALREATLQGRADVLICYVPDVAQVVAQLRAAGHAPEAIAALGETGVPGS